MSDKAHTGRSSHPATRRYAEAMDALELQGSEAVVPIREYVRQLRNESRRYRIKSRLRQLELEDRRED
ncbi:hypothetical protein BANT918_01360 [Brevibacterium antiquum CNRZ 918]|uniref:Uncharacterized protein n=1 Tax=Brevibacterium antiquum CNRZ 918 TaxID=1255637 RepID=A0A2H1J2K0_9MICO|nr:hypothetical protein BANT918_01360 [Brevibacterium antiquum CNRZ 918]